MSHDAAVPNALHPHTWCDPEHCDDSSAPTEHRATPREWTAADGTEFVVGLAKVVDGPVYGAEVTAEPHILFEVAQGHRAITPRLTAEEARAMATELLSAADLLDAENNQTDEHTLRVLHPSVPTQRGAGVLPFQPLGPIYTIVAENHA
jgi:hypothetical protein